MGQSGCGKTTLLRIIAAAFLPTRGAARILGRTTAELDRDGLYAMRRKMGMLFQFGALFTICPSSTTSPSPCASTTPSCPRSCCTTW